MKLQRQPNIWSCAVTSFAMAFDVSVQQLITIIGHDGSEIVWPENPDPYCRRGFHIQELCVAGYQLQRSVTEFLTHIESYSRPNCPPHLIAPNREVLTEIISDHTCVLQLYACNRRHMVVTHEHQVFDPAGRDHDFDNMISVLQSQDMNSKFKIEAIYKVDKSD